jgi:tetratricopeptide (TPR) repeat protein
MTVRKSRPSKSAARENTRPEPPAAPARASGRLLWLLPVLWLATLAAYQPAWHGGLLWDDDGHITGSALRSVEGLRRIWFEVGATQQYYPLVHSTFWVLHRLWGDHTLGYHLLNISLHACSAFLVAVLLRRLNVRGAALAAAIFALHPVHVESVAWITELKNTLSGALYLTAALAYLHFDAGRRKRFYALALGLFVLALLSKTVTATLPAALLVVFWWQRGRLTWRTDAAPLAPFFALGIAGGLLTAWVERTFIGARGEEFQFTLIERGLIAGRVIWFYLAKLVWPSDLIFIYRRWPISESAPWQYLYPLGVVLLLAGVWRWRTRSRAPLAALLFFCGTLFPALGFFNVFPFRFSFVADHFQYLASLGIIALGAAGLTNLAERWRRRFPQAPAAVALGVLVPFAVLTWQQSHVYVNADTLYRSTINRNPECWLAYNNLGELKLHGSVDDAKEAVVQITESLRINPNNPDAHNNLAIGLQRLGRPDEALTHYQHAVRGNPRLAAAQRNLGLLLLEMGRLDEAVAVMQEAVRYRPRAPEARTGLGDALQRAGRFDEAIAQYAEAIRAKPDYADAHQNMGLALERAGRRQEAVAAYENALRLLPGSAAVHAGLGYVLLKMGRRDEALTHVQEALRLDPAYAPAHYSLGNILQGAGRLEEAVAQYQEALKAEQGAGAAGIHNDLGVALAMLGRFDVAAAHFKDALRLKPDFPDARANLARALAVLGKGKTPPALSDVHR